uniref:Uncharacterized protein n=1 Tax=Rhizophora mucronata TaxID=61149 RepID=A0A2P2NTX8_RHIMU
MRHCKNFMFQINKSCGVIVIQQRKHYDHKVESRKNNLAEPKSRDIVQKMATWERLFSLTSQVLSRTTQPNRND